MDTNTANAHINAGLDELRDNMSKERELAELLIAVAQGKLDPNNIPDYVLREPIRITVKSLINIIQVARSSK